VTAIMTDSVKSSLATSNSGLSASGLESQIADLQRQCADWRGCATTSSSDKEKEISALSGKIQSLQIKLNKVQQVAPASSAFDVKDKAVTAPPLLPPSQAADGVNRPDTDAFATAGSVINLSI
jgi:hypothetical protein